MKTTQPPPGADFPGNGEPEPVVYWEVVYPSTQPFNPTVTNSNTVWITPTQTTTVLT